MHRTARIALGGIVAAALLALAPRAQAAMAGDDFRCVDISTTQVGCCLFDEGGNPTKCFTVTIQ